LTHLRSPRSLLILALVALGGAVLAIVITQALGQSRQATAPDFAADAPAITAAGEAWTLDQLLAQARAGEIKTISALTVPADPLGADRTSLIALTDTGAIHEIRPEVSIGDALDVIRSAGYAPLLSDEAIALDPAGRSAGPSSLIGVAMSAAFLVLMILVMIRMRRGSLGSWRPSRFGRDRKSKSQTGEAERPTVVMADVAGADEAKVELNETIEFLRDPARFARLGASPIRGVMLYGPPGTGKTLLAKAVAAEAGVPFFSVSGSEFVEKFVGVGAGRVRGLFANARAAGRAVIFIDEIDAMAKTRGGDSHEEREQTLNQLLVEMDGFGANDNVVVIGATNRLDTLDPAVLRPGRFTRKIHVPMPDRQGRAEILGVHAAGKPLTADVDLAALARKTYGFSGAALADLLNEAAILAARSGLEAIGPAEIHGGWLKTALGTSRKRSMDDRERSIIAAHEAGHAVCGFLHGDKRRVEEISLFAHGDALGVTVSSSEDNDLPSETDLRARLVALMGGRVAEELLFAEVTGGASNDFEKATSIATTMVVRFGMGIDPESTEEGATGRGILTTLVGTQSVAVNTEVKDAQARAIRHILDEAYAAARRTLISDMRRLRAVAGYLYEQERIDGDEFDALMAGSLVPVDMEGWRAATASPRPWESIEPLFARPVSTAAATVAAAPEPVPTRSAPTIADVPIVVPVLAPRPAARRTEAQRRYRAGRRLPALPTRLRRSFAALVRELADEGDR
jgi:cell division protease FtsH